MNPDYADGITAPRQSHTGRPLPSAREVSLTIHRPSYSIDPHFTVMLAVYGQFLDHDITATALNQGIAEYFYIMFLSHVKQQYDNFQDKMVNQ